MPLDWKAAAPFVFLPFVGSIPGSILTKSNIPTWYEVSLHASWLKWWDFIHRLDLQKLKRPNWRPPNWAFGPVWTTLYASMGYASYLVRFDGVNKWFEPLFACQVASESDLYHENHCFLFEILGLQRRRWVWRLCQDSPGSLWHPAGSQLGLDTYLL
jgi:hypothetical protein